MKTHTLKDFEQVDDLLSLAVVESKPTFSVVRESCSSRGLLAMAGELITENGDSW